MSNFDGLIIINVALFVKMKRLKSLDLSFYIIVCIRSRLLFSYLPSKFVSERKIKMPRTGNNIYKRKDGRWEGRYIKSYSSAGKAKYGYVYSKTYAEVKTKLSIAISESNKIKSEPSSNYLFSEIAAKWLERIKLECKISTYNKYRNNYEKQIKSVFGKYPTSKISSEMVESFIMRLLTNGRSDNEPFSNKTVQDILMEIKQIIKYAEEHYGVESQLSNYKTNIKKKPKETNTISASSVRNLCNELLRDVDLYKIGVLISLYTGIRIGELCALQWKDISFDDGLLYISKTAQRVQQLDNPYKKTTLCVLAPKSISSNRIIPLPKTLLDLLNKFKNNDNYYIMTGKEKCADPRTMQYHFKKYLKACNIEDTNFHSLRHTFATHCLEIGFDIKTLSEILGHSSVNITLDRYVHSSLKMKQDSMNKLVIGF